MSISPARIESCITDLLAKRAADASICPSEVARHLSPDDWRPLMPDIRDVARTMARAGRIVVTAKGARLDPDEDWTGPIRLGRAQAPVSAGDSSG